MSEQLKQMAGQVYPSVASQHIGLRPNNTDCNKLLDEGRSVYGYYTHRPGEGIVFVPFGVSAQTKG